MHSIRESSIAQLDNGRKPRSPRYAVDQPVGRYRIVRVKGRRAYYNGRHGNGKRRIDTAWCYRVACLVCGAEREHTQTDLREHEQGKRLMGCPVCREVRSVGRTIPVFAESAVEESRNQAYGVEDDPVGRAMTLWATPPSVIEEGRICLR